MVARFRLVDRFDVERFDDAFERVFAADFDFAFTFDAAFRAPELTFLRADDAVFLAALVVFLFVEVFFFRPVDVAFFRPADAFFRPAEVAFFAADVTRFPAEEAFLRAEEVLLLDLRAEEVLLLDLRAEDDFRAVRRGLLSESSSESPISFFATPTAAGIATPIAVPATIFWGVVNPPSSSSRANWSTSWRLPRRGLFRVFERLDELRDDPFPDHLGAVRSDVLPG